MKKTIALVICSFLLFNIGTAQEISSASQEEIKRNISQSFAVNIKSIIGLSDYGYFISQASPFAFNYQLAIDNWGIRASYGGAFNNMERESEFNEDIVSNNSTHNIRLGVNYKAFEKGRFTARVGLDGALLSDVYKYDYMSPDGLRNYNKRDQTRTGLGPVGILSFAITEHVSVAVESWYYVYKLNMTQEYTNGGEEIITDTTTGWSSELFEPSSVFLTLKF